MQAGGGAGGIFRQTPCWAGAHDPWDNDSTWNKSWTLNLLGHPGAPGLLIFTFNPGSWNHCHQRELTNHGPWKGQIAGRKDQDVFYLLDWRYLFPGEEAHRSQETTVIFHAWRTKMYEWRPWILFADRWPRAERGYCVIHFLSSHIWLWSPM